MTTRHLYLETLWCGIHYWIICFTYDPLWIAISVSFLGLSLKQLCEQP